MKMKMMYILAIILIVLVGCEPAQEGQPADISYVPIDEIGVEDETEDEMMEEDLGEEDFSEDGTSEMEEELDEGEMEEVSEDMEEVEEVMEEETETMEEEVDEEMMEEETEDMEEVEEVMEEEVDEEMMEEVEETEEEVSNEIVIIVQETETVNLQPVAYDPDTDELTYTYTTPLDNGGKWKTTYGDMGEYTVTITVSDGELTASKDALLIVNKKEEPPQIDFASPEDVDQEIDENSEIEFSVKASDVNKDPLSIEWKIDGETVATGNKFTFVADYDSSGSHTIKVDVSDGTTIESMIWALAINNVDRAPVLKILPDVTVKETESVVIIPEASDPDGDILEYIIDEPVGDDGIWDTGYEDSGVYNINVIVTDGEKEDSQEVKVTVINVNRAPVIENIVQVE